MIFMQWLRSLDELLYEIVGWIIFFPLTMWKVLRAPLRIMRYADEQLTNEEGSQFVETLSPPIFLVLALVVAQAVGLALGGGTNPIVKSHHGLASLVDDNTTLLMLRTVLFSMFPIIMAARLVRRKAQRIDRKTLKRPFYSQCMVAAPFALSVSVAGALIAMHNTLFGLLGGLLAVATFFLYGTVQAKWFTTNLGVPVWSGFLDASVGMIESVVVASLCSYLFVL